MEPAVFLDRDNTLIANDGDLGDPNLVRLIPGVPAGLLALRKAGFRLVVVTNQGGVARGKFTEADVDAVHQRIASLVENETGADGLIDRFYYCPYHPEGTKPEYRRDHSWRKPHPGMLVQAARDMALDLSRSWLIGDQVRDIRAGKAAGCRTVLISSDNGIVNEANPTVAVSSFAAAVEAILRRQPGSAGGVTNKAEPAQREEPGKGVNGKQMTAVSGGGVAVKELERVATEEIAEPKREVRPNADRATAVMVEPRAASKANDAPAPSPTPAPAPTTQAPSTSPNHTASPTEMADLKRAVIELAEEIRAQRMHATEFTLLKLAAGACQLLVVLLVLLGLLEINNLEAFAKWFLGAVVAQLITIALLLLDMRG